MTTHFLLLNTFCSDPACSAVLRCCHILAPRAHSFSKNRDFVYFKLGTLLNWATQLSMLSASPFRSPYIAPERLLILQGIAPGLHRPFHCWSSITPTSSFADISCVPWPLPYPRSLCVGSWTEVQIGTDSASVLEDAGLHLCNSPALPFPAMDPVPIPLALSSHSRAVSTLVCLTGPAPVLIPGCALKSQQGLDTPCSPSQSLCSLL